MVKQFSILALTGLIALPTLAAAGGGATPADMEKKINELSRQLDELKAQMAQQNETVTKVSSKVNEMDTKSEAWDMASRFKFNGDFRARGDYYHANNVFAAGTPLGPNGMFGTAGGDQHNDTIMTNRLRLNMSAKATEDVEFKGRLAMYKAWGMQSTPDGLGGGFPVFDGNTSRTPSDSALYVDRAFVNWNNIGGAPVWFSVGRRPTSDGPPAQLRMNNDSRMATPPAFMDYPFDGLSLGYGYDWGNDALGTGRIRFCYGRGFENGLQAESSSTSINDTDFAGLSWDVFQQGPRFLNIQTFGAFNLFNYPEFTNSTTNTNFQSLMGPRANLGNIYHTSTIYMDKISNLNYFIGGGWSHSKPNDNGMFNDVAGMMARTNGANTDSEDGYSIYTGVRYDIDNLGLKLGAEYNYGSQYWVAFSPGHDDLYMSKLATRGNAYELYMIYDLPTGPAISKYAKTFMRLGWQFYDYNYSGGFDWNVKPYNLDTEKDKLQAIGQNPVQSANQVYLTFEAYF